MAQTSVEWIGNLHDDKRDEAFLGVVSIVFFVGK